LRMSEELLGRTLRCPRCQGVVTAEAPPLEAPVDAPETVDPRPALIMDPAAEAFAVAPPAPLPASGPEVPPVRRRPRRQKKRALLARLGLPPIVVEGRLIAAGTAIVCAGLIGLGFYYGIRYALRIPPPPVIAAERWQTHEVANRIRVLLPGIPQRQE